MLPGNFELLLPTEDRVCYDEVMFSAFCEEQSAHGVSLANSVFPNGSFPKAFAFSHSHVEIAEKDYLIQFWDCCQDGVQFGVGGFFHFIISTKGWIIRADSCMTLEMQGHQMFTGSSVSFPMRPFLIAKPMLWILHSSGNPFQKKV